MTSLCHLHQLPDGVACANRINTKPLPTFKRYFSYRAEILDSETSDVQHYAVSNYLGFIISPWCLFLDMLYTTLLFVDMLYITLLFVDMMYIT